MHKIYIYDGDGQLCYFSYVCDDAEIMCVIRKHALPYANYSIEVVEA